MKKHLAPNHIRHSLANLALIGFGVIAVRTSEDIRKNAIFALQKNHQK